MKMRTAMAIMAKAIKIPRTMFALWIEFFSSLFSETGGACLKSFIFTGLLCLMVGGTTENK